MSGVNGGERRVRLHHRRRRQRGLRAREPPHRDRAGTACCCWKRAARTERWIHIPLGYGKHFPNPKVNWLFETEPERECHGRASSQPRGKVLGGSSSINGLVYVRGQHEDYDDWRDLGNAGWGYADVLPYFRKAEDKRARRERVSRRRRTAHASPIRPTCRLRRLPRGGRSVRLSAQSRLQRREAGRLRLQPVDAAQRAPLQHGGGYLRPARSRANLTVATDAHATRISVRGKRATGVEYLQGGPRNAKRARREVLLAGGAFSSPQLMQLSGLGPARC